MTEPLAPFRCRTVWISDLHIGTPEFKTDLLIDFLACHPSETLYLVGDVIDLRYIGRTGRWRRDHQRAVAALIAASRRSRVMLLPGNHDGALKEIAGLTGSNFAFAHRHLHRTADGRRLLVVHGDDHDRHIRTDLAEWKIDLACFVYYGLLRAEHHLNLWRLRRGRGLWRQVARIKERLGFWQAYVSRFERSLLAEAQRLDIDGVVCGHIHVPRIRREGRLLYLNAGDWVENCTALVEDWSGEIRLVRWDRFAVTGRAAAGRRPVPRR